jgi:hypothetical protein
MKLPDLNHRNFFPNWGRNSLLAGEALLPF